MITSCTYQTSLKILSMDQIRYQISLINVISFHLTFHHVKNLFHSNLLVNPYSIQQSISTFLLIYSIHSNHFHFIKFLHIHSKHFYFLQKNETYH